MERKRHTQYYQRFLIDLDVEGKEFTVVRGGAGGYGNGKHHYIKQVNTGKLGQEKHLFLELKCLADVGLVGFPNV
jgi:GTP-binding protein